MTQSPRKYSTSTDDPDHIQDLKTKFNTIHREKQQRTIIGHFAEKLDEAHIHAYRETKRQASLQPTEQITDLQFQQAEKTIKKCHSFPARQCLRSTFPRKSGWRCCVRRLKKKLAVSTVSPTPILTDRRREAACSPALPTCLPCMLLIPSAW